MSGIVHNDDDTAIQSSDTIGGPTMPTEVFMHYLSELCFLIVNGLAVGRIKRELTEQG